MKIEQIESILAMRAPFVMTSGVYFLFNGDCLVYIGQSVDVNTRLSVHVRGPLEFDSVAVIPCHADDLLRTEAAYIKLHTPPGNVKVPGRKAKMTRRQIRQYEALRMLPVVV